MIRNSEDVPPTYRQRRQKSNMAPELYISLAHSLIGHVEGRLSRLVLVRQIENIRFLLNLSHQNVCSQMFVA